MNAKEARQATNLYSDLLIDRVVECSGSLYWPSLNIVRVVVSALRVLGATA